MLVQPCSRAFYFQQCAARILKSKCSYCSGCSFSIGAPFHQTAALVDTHSVVFTEEKARAYRRKVTGRRRCDELVDELDLLRISRISGPSVAWHISPFSRSLSPCRIEGVIARRLHTSGSQPHSIAACVFSRPETRNAELVTNHVLARTSGRSNSTPRRTLPSQKQKRAGWQIHAFGSLIVAAYAKQQIVLDNYSKIMYSCATEIGNDEHKIQRENKKSWLPWRLSRNHSSSH